MHFPVDYDKMVFTLSDAFNHQSLTFINTKFCDILHMLYHIFIFPPILPEM